jgi:hypothetical protein
MLKIKTGLNKGSSGMTLWFLSAQGRAGAAMKARSFKCLRGWLSRMRLLLFLCISENWKEESI